MTMRTFIALPVPDEIADHLSRLHQSVPREAGRITWVGADAIHVTCTFLGEVEEDRITPIGAALERVASGIAPYEMSLDGVGAFPGFRRARVGWAGLEKGEEETCSWMRRWSRSYSPPKGGRSTPILPWAECVSPAERVCLSTPPRSGSSLTNTGSAGRRYCTAAN